MAGELQTPGNGTGRTIYFVLRNRTGQLWSTSGGTGGFAGFLSGAWAQYSIAAAEQGVNNYYLGDMPAAMPAGILAVCAHQQTGGSPDQLLDPRIANADQQWTGLALFPLSDLATSGQLSLIAPQRIYRGQAVSGFPFKLVSSADHITNFTSGVVSGQISRNGGSFGTLQSGNISEIGNGWYSCNLTSGDLNADTIALFFTATNISGQGTSDQRDFGMILQRSSGSLA